MYPNSSSLFLDVPTELYRTISTIYIYAQKCIINGNESTMRALCFSPMQSYVSLNVVSDYIIVAYIKKCYEQVKCLIHIQITGLLDV